MNQIIYSKWVFEDDDIRSAQIYRATSLIADSLEPNTLNATVRCSDSSILEFEQDTRLTYVHSTDLPAYFYIQDITRTGPDEYAISAMSAIGRLIHGEQHYGGIYTGQTVGTGYPRNLRPGALRHQNKSARRTDIWLAANRIPPGQSGADPVFRRRMDQG